MAGEEEPHFRGDGEGGFHGFGEPPSAEEIRRDLRRQPKPASPQTYDLSEAAFWQHRYLPEGSVLVYSDPASDQDPPPKVAVLVTKTESQQTGVWVSVKVLGASLEEAKKTAQKYFSRGKKKIHLCYGNEHGVCDLLREEALHLTVF